MMGYGTRAVCGLIVLVLIGAVTLGISLGPSALFNRPLVEAEADKVRAETDELRAQNDHNQKLRNIELQRAKQQTDYEKEQQEIQLEFARQKAQQDMRQKAIISHAIKT